MKRIYSILILFLFALLLITCGKSDYKSFLNGKWKSEIQDIEFNFNEGWMKTEIKLMGLTQKTDNKIEYVKTLETGAVTKTPNGISNITIIDDNKIKIQKEGSPLTVELTIAAQ